MYVYKPPTGMTEIAVPLRGSKVILRNTKVDDTLEAYESVADQINTHAAVIVIYPKKDLQIKAILQIGPLFILELHNPKRSWLYNLFLSKLVVDSAPGLYEIEPRFPVDQLYTIDVEKKLQHLKTKH
jgi:hypothetical protein